MDVIHFLILFRGRGGITGKLGITVLLAHSLSPILDKHLLLGYHKLFGLFT